MFCLWSICDATTKFYKPIISCFIKIQNGSASLVLAYPGCPRKMLLNGYDDGDGGDDGDDNGLFITVLVRNRCQDIMMIHSLVFEVDFLAALVLK